MLKIYIYIYIYIDAWKFTRFGGLSSRRKKFFKSNLFQLGYTCNCGRGEQIYIASQNIKNCDLLFFRMLGSAKSQFPNTITFKSFWMSGVGSSWAFHGRQRCASNHTVRYRKGLGTCDVILCVAHTLQNALETGKEAKLVQGIVDY